MDQFFGSFTVLSPWLPLVGASLLVLIVEALTKKDTEKYISLSITLIGLGTALFFALSLPDTTTTPGFFVTADLVTKALAFIVLVGAILITVLSHEYLTKIRGRFGEYYALIMLSSLGALGLGYASDLFTFFIAFEVMSIAVYILAGFSRYSTRSTESAMKYFILGAFSTGFMLMGTAFIYGTTGEVVFSQILASLSAQDNPSVWNLAYLGFGLMLVGFLFKLGVVPFHTWVPDVYEGAPTVVTAFMATVVKVGAIAVFLRLVHDSFQVEELKVFWSTVTWGGALLTVVYGNFATLAQKNVKRMLAYSSVSHAGYLLIGITALALVPLGTGMELQVKSIQSALLFYVFAYLFMNTGAFAAIVGFSAYSKNELTHIEDFKGLGYRAPLLGLGMTVFMLSLAGIPLTAGFIGKFVVFKSLVVAAGMESWSWQFHGLVMVAILMSLVSVFYYMRVVVYLFFKTPVETTRVETNWNFTAVVFVCMVMTLILGVIPNTFFGWIGDILFVSVGL
jgi:NADH-quinone oxidoreductase subunit N